MSHNHTYSNTRIRRYWILSFLSFLAFAGVAAMVVLDRVFGFDSFFIELVRGFEQPAITDIAKGFSYIGSTVPIIVICVAVSVLLYALRLRREIILFFTVVLGSQILNMVLKMSFRRIRPDINRLVEVTGYSFPSGHSMAAFALYGILTYLLWKNLNTVLRRVFVLILFSVMILGIGLSRIYLGVHYPSDVFGGYLASCSWLMFSIGMYESLRSRN
ncbi:MAG: phosphatase PAP2 family protein [Bacillota bacterium]